MTQLGSLPGWLRLGGNVPFCHLFQLITTTSAILTTILTTCFLLDLPNKGYILLNLTVIYTYATSYVQLSCSILLDTRVHEKQQCGLSQFLLSRTSKRYLAIWLDAELERHYTQDLTNLMGNYLQATKRDHIWSLLLSTPLRSSTRRTSSRAYRVMFSALVRPVLPDTSKRSCKADFRLLDTKLFGEHQLDLTALPLREMITLTREDLLLGFLYIPDCLYMPPDIKKSKNGKRTEDLFEHSYVQVLWKSSWFVCESLLSTAMRMAMETELPTIIAGDLNHKPETLPTWTTMQKHGWRHTFELYQEKYGTQMPYTYLQTSWPDMMMISPHLLHLVEDITVDQSGWVAGHHPLSLKLTLPSKPGTKTTWRQPQSWLPYGPPTKLIEKYYSRSPPAPHLLEEAGIGPSIAFKNWAESIEKAVGAAIHEQHELQPEQQPYSALPRNAHGRCQLPKLVSVPQQRSIKPAWNGHYTPSLNTAPIRVRQQTRQIRRVQSLKARVGKLATYTWIWPNTWEQLHEEWRAILSGPGYQGGFPHWLRQRPELPDPEDGLPDYNSLHDMEQLLKYEIHILEKQASQFQKSLHQYHRWFDRRHGHLKKAFASIREEGNGCLETAQIQSRSAAILDNHDRLGLVTLQLHQKLPLRPDLPVYVDDTKATLIRYEHPTLEIMPDDVERDLSNHCEVTQLYSTAEPTLVGNALATYWNQFWQRDLPHEQTDAAPWSAFTEILNRLPELPPLQLDILDKQIWRDAIGAVKSTTARGICGFFADEIKQLAGIDGILDDLITICENLTTFPSWFMMSKVTPVALRSRVFCLEGVRKDCCTISSTSWNSSTLKKVLLRWGVWLWTWWNVTTRCRGILENKRCSSYKSHPNGWIFGSNPSRCFRGGGHWMDTLSHVACPTLAFQKATPGQFSLW